MFFSLVFPWFTLCSTYITIFRLVIIFKAFITRAKFTFYRVENLFLKHIVYMILYSSTEANFVVECFKGHIRTCWSSGKRFQFYYSSS